MAGAELFVDNAAAAAGQLRVSLLAVGVLLAGAEPEELVTAVLAALQDRPGLAVGDAVGANVTMLTAALGLAAVARPLPVGPRVRRYAAGAAVAGLLALAVLLDGRVGRVEGLLLVTAYAACVAAVWRRERTPPATGGVAAVEGATRLVEALGRTDEAVGLTALALATTAELFALVLAAARRGVAEVAVAAVVGSAAYNSTATLGAAALARPLAVDGVLGAALLSAALPLSVMALGRQGTLRRRGGAALLATYLVFLWLVLG